MVESPFGLTFHPPKRIEPMTALLSCCFATATAFRSLIRRIRLAAAMSCSSTSKRSSMKPCFFIVSP